MPEPDLYLAVRDGPETELKEKSSRFLAQALAVTDEADSAARLTGIRKRYHAATHHCWAHRLGPPEALIERADDGGEPDVARTFEELGVRTSMPEAGDGRA